MRYPGNISISFAILGVAAGIENILRRHQAQVVAQRLADAAPRRVDQHQLRHLTFGGGEAGGIERLKIYVQQP